MPGSGRFRPGIRIVVRAEAATASSEPLAVGEAEAGEAEVGDHLERLGGLMGTGGLGLPQPLDHRERGAPRPARTASRTARSIATSQEGGGSRSSSSR